jgi:cytidylate kinase
LENKIVHVAIDGPVASGKTSVGKELANILGFLFLDTGVMYRAVTWAVLENKIQPSDEIAVTKLVEKLEIQIRQPTIDDGRMNDILVDEIDVTWKIRQPAVNNSVSEVSQYAGVREILTKKQREIAQNKNIIMVGRDIGTVVLPSANVKIFLVASVSERIQRRFKEEELRGSKISLGEILKNVQHRDQIDTMRTIAPLIPADNAIIIKTDGKTVEMVASEIIEIINENK